MKKEINSILIGNNRRLLDIEKVKELSDSIKQIGLINPITVTFSNILVAGQHRLEAFKLLGFNEIECNVIESDDERLLELIEIDENLIRNELHWVDNDEQIIRRKAIYELMHPESILGNKLKNLKQNKNTENDTMSLSDKVSFTADTSIKTGTSQRNVQRSIQRANNIVPEIKEALKLLDVSKSEGSIIAHLEPSKQLQVLDQLQKKPHYTLKIALIELQKLQKIDERKILIEQLNKKINTDFDSQIIKKYNCIVIDPPWGLSEKNGIACYDYNPIHMRGSPPYPTMELSEIEKLNLPADDDCVLFLWTTQAAIKYSYDLLEKWGFKYKATLVWNKESMGLGKAIRLQCEFCIMGFKGNPIVNSGSETDFISEKRREHSRKPEAFYQFVNRFVVGKKLDYFAREERIGWDTYGVESDKFSYTEKSIVG